ncbi:ATP-dependent 6-phosphofructokinase [Aerococcaceae bacterium WGS1372]
MKRIGLLTSGGDAPGMNAAINGVVDEARRHNIEVRGYLEGYAGLIDNRYFDLTAENVKPHHGIGGTFIGSSRSEEFKKNEVQAEVVERLKEEGIEGLIVIGGDGSFRGALSLSKQGIQTIGIPGTIDNDIPITELTLGFKTAVRNVVETVDMIMQSAASHRHLYAIEVMGRKAGDIAEWAGRSLDADGIISKAGDFDVEKVRQTIEASQAMGKRFQLFVIAEGVMTCGEFQEIVERETDYPIHPLMLGHIQRGGNPVAEDRILGLDFGEHAVQLLINGQSGRCTAVIDNQVTDVSIEETLAAINH